MKTKTYESDRKYHYRVSFSLLDYSTKSDNLKFTETIEFDNPNLLIARMEAYKWYFQSLWDLENEGIYNLHSTVGEFVDLETYRYSLSLDLVEQDSYDEFQYCLLGSWMDGLEAIEQETLALSRFFESKDMVSTKVLVAMIYS